MTAFSEASSSLRSLAGSGQDDELAENERPVFTNEEALHFAMERMYRDGLRQPQFKVCFSVGLGVFLYTKQKFWSHNRV